MADDIEEGGSFDPAVQTKMLAGAAHGVEAYHAFETPDAGMEWASEAAEASGVPYALVYCPEADEFRAGPVDELDVVATGSSDFRLLAVYDEDGEFSDLDDDMFSDDEAVDAAAGMWPPGPEDGTANDDTDIAASKGVQDVAPRAFEHAAYLCRLSRAALVERARRRIRVTRTSLARAARGPSARAWRRRHFAQLQAYRDAAAGVPGAQDEAVVKHRAFDTRRKALEKKRTVMDPNRRRVARNAKLWRMRNKSRAKRYGSLYHGPHSKVKEAAVDMGESWVDLLIDARDGGVFRPATAEDLARFIAAAGDEPLVVEGRAVFAERRKRRQSVPADPKAKMDQAPPASEQPHVPNLVSLADITAATEARAADPMRGLARLILEARKHVDLDAAVARLRKDPAWVDEGWDRARIIREIDPSFIHHAEHFDRLLAGGTNHKGEPYPGGGGLRWGGLVVTEEEALLRVMGSREYPKAQEIYQQTVRFANYRRVAEAEGLTWPEKARLLLTKDSLRVHCDCEAFKFYHNRAATVKGFALMPEEREAPVNNPNDRAGVCKHLNVTLKWLGAQYPQLASEMKQYHERRRLDSGPPAV